MSLSMAVADVFPPEEEANDPNDGDGEGERKEEEMEVRGE